MGGKVLKRLFPRQCAKYVVFCTNEGRKNYFSMRRNISGFELRWFRSFPIRKHLKGRMLLSKCSFACTHRAKLITPRVQISSRHFSKVEPPDRELLEKFASPARFHGAIFDRLFRPAKTQLYSAVKESGMMPAGIMNQFRPFYCLQNPILQRYGIDGADLMTGAKCGFEVINEAVSTMNESQLHEFLLSVTTANYTDLLNFCSNRGFQFPPLLHSRSTATPKIMLRNLITKIVGQGPMFNFLDMGIVGDMEIKVPRQEELRLRYQRDFASFPTGAVLAYMDIQYEGSEEFTEITKELREQFCGKKKTMEEFKSAGMKINAAKRTVLSFRACISGEVPLEWMLVDINGPRGIHYAEFES